LLISSITVFIVNHHYSASHAPFCCFGLQKQQEAHAADLEQTWKEEQEHQEASQQQVRACVRACEPRDICMRVCDVGVRVCDVGVRVCDVDVRASSFLNV